jgi:hypothetical protein
VHSATVISRMPASLAPRRASSFLGLAAIACLVLAACSAGADYPSLFPSVHDIPPPRADTPLDRNQVQQATEDLISARDHLSAESQGAQAKYSTSSAVKSPARSPAKSATKSPANSPAKSADKSSHESSAPPATGPGAARKQPSPPVDARQTPGMDAEQTAGAETK